MTRKKNQKTRIRALKGRLHLNKRDYQTLLHLTTLSRRLHDKTVQVIQQTGTKNYYKLYHILKTTPEYQLLPSQPAQQTIKLALQSYKQHRKYNPGRRATQVLIFPTQQFRVKGRYILLNLGKNYQKTFGRRYIRIKNPKILQNRKTRLKQVIIVPRHDGVWFNVVYIYEELAGKTPSPGLSRNDQFVEAVSRFSPDPARVMAIDLGVNNFATVVSTVGPAFIIEGRGLKSLKIYCTRKIAELQSIYDRAGQQPGRKFYQLLRRCEAWTEDFVNKTVHAILEYVVHYDIGVVVIGWNRGFKNGTRKKKQLNGSNRRNLWFMPFGAFRRKLRDRLEELGVRYIEVSEAYTSVTDALALEPIGPGKHSGKQVHRGLFQSKTGRLVNADVNAAINILRRVAGDYPVSEAFGLGVTGKPRGIPGNGRVDRPKTAKRFENPKGFPVRVRIPWGPFSNRLEEFQTLWDSVIKTASRFQPAGRVGLHEAPSDREG